MIVNLLASSLIFVCYKLKQARNPGTVEKSIANSGGRTYRTDWIDGIDRTDRTDETDGTVGTDGSDWE